MSKVKDQNRMTMGYGGEQQESQIQVPRQEIWTPSGEHLTVSGDPNRQTVMVLTRDLVKQPTYQRDTPSPDLPDAPQSFPDMTMADFPRESLFPTDTPPGEVAAVSPAETLPDTPQARMTLVDYNLMQVQKRAPGLTKTRLLEQPYFLEFIQRPHIAAFLRENSHLNILGALSQVVTSPPDKFDAAFKIFLAHYTSIFSETELGMRVLMDIWGEIPEYQWHDEVQEEPPQQTNSEQELAAYDAHHQKMQRTQRVTTGTKVLNWTLPITAILLLGMLIMILLKKT